MRTPARSQIRAERGERVTNRGHEVVPVEEVSQPFL
jgi:hypothetical protein